ncbi:hypothetical protein BU17DRAFT_70598 [Hysterangium stoloniferum]|nr:hypothetical protein BU17DRAFT_70598 [Hysterangium stoloniferum]
MVKDISVKEHGFAKTTNIKYNQRVREARMWLKELVETEQSLTIPPGANELGCHLGSFDWTPGELEGAFNNIPTQASPWILGLFIAYKCFTQKTKVTTAWQIHTAFKQVWETVDPNGRWSGPWRWDHEKGTGCGNPAILEMLNASLMPSNGYGQNNSMVKSTLSRFDARRTGEAIPGRILEATSLCSEALYDAFATSGFTLWTRNFKLAKLQYKHITLDLKTNDDYKYTYFKVSLFNRKNWAHHQTRDEIIHRHEYHIYEQPENPNIDMHFHFLRWFQFSNQFIYHCLLEVDDYIFPAIGSNGIARIETPIPHDTIQKWLDKFFEACEINLGRGRLTTHCFRRGGAQYCFMYAHFGKRWSLAIIRWWGGWAEGEHATQIPAMQQQGTILAHTLEHPK